MLEPLEKHLKALKKCAACPSMTGPVVAPPPVHSRVYLVGQAPGSHEGAAGRPFAWTAGKTLFGWFARLGVSEAQFRERVFMAAVCRCFPGKAKSGGDRVPSATEIDACAVWMKREVAILKPALILAVGRLAIERFLPPAALTERIGKQFRVSAFGHDCDVIPLPHPSGASTWFRMEPGIGLLNDALKLIGEHSAWNEIH